MVGLKVEHVRLLVCTHAHSDHYGPGGDDRGARGLRAVDAPRPSAHDASAGRTRAAAFERPHRGRALLPACPRSRCASGRSARRGQSYGVAADRGCPTAPCCRAWSSRPISGHGRSCLTPGHAPSHVCLWQPERRLLISGDHLLGRVSPYYDYGYSPDPAGEFLASLDRIEALGRAAVPLGPRAHLRRRPRATSRPIASSSASGWRARARAARGRAVTAFDARPARVRRGDDADERELVAERDALLPAPPAGHRARRGRRCQPERWSAAEQARGLSSASSDRDTPRSAPRRAGRSARGAAVGLSRRGRGSAGGGTPAGREARAAGVVFVVVAASGRCFAAVLVDDATASAAGRLRRRRARRLRSGRGARLTA
jgi:glyoxylase-like metal-dependent hydrolase (beta-lactamase superfamily II)